MPSSNFWSAQTAAPKRSYRFMVQINDTVLWWAKNVNTPSFDVSEIEHSFLGNTYFFPGKVAWSTVSMTLVDPVTPDAVAFTNSLLTQSGYMIPKDTSALQRSTMDKPDAIAAAGDLDLTISVLDADGAAIEVWTLNQAFIKSAKFGDLSYEDEQMRTVDIEWRYDWASCEFTSEHPTAGVKGTDYFEVGKIPSTVPEYNP
jgi:hypothetical protein